MIENAELSKMQALIVEECDAIKALLLAKNADYGNSVVSPRRIFSKSDTIEQIHVRIDDKLSRIANSNKKEIKEDTVQDLIGYLILLRVTTKLNTIDDDALNSIKLLVESK